MSTSSAARPAAPRVSGPATHPPLAVRDQRERRWVGVVLLGLWVAALAASCWVGPWQTPGQRFVDDVRAHRVTAWEVRDRSPEQLLTGLALTDTPGSEAVGPGIVVWRDTLGRARWADVTTSGDDGSAPLVERVPAGAAAPGSAADAPVSEQQRARTWATALTAGAGAHRDAVPGWARSLLGLERFAGWVIVLLGPRPRRGTRWYWMWVGMLPYGIGLAALAWFEHLRPRRPTVGVADERWFAVERRRSGAQGFFTLVAGGVAVTAVVALVQAAVS